jgi:SAM-dependent methyltransferase
MTSTFNASNADGYDMLMGRWSRELAVPFIDFSGLAQTGTILDVGCGTGSFSRVALTRPDTAPIVGVDVSTAFVRHARSTVTDPRASFDVADATALPFADTTFAQTISMLVLSFVPDSTAAIREMKRVTKPGGTVAAAMWNFEGALPMNRMIYDVSAGLGLPVANVRNASMSLIREGELAEAFAAAELVNVTRRDLLIWTRFKSFEDYWTPYLAGQAPIGAYVAGLRDEQRKRLQDAMFDAYCGGRPDGPRSYACVAHAAKGTVP